MQKASTRIGLLAIVVSMMMVGCDPADLLPTHTLLVDSEQMSTVHGVLVEQPYGVVKLEFSDEVDESILEHLRLVDRVIVFGRGG